MPTGVKSNMPKGSPSSSSRTRDTMMLGEVPTRVTMPPSSEPKAIGMRKLDGGVLVRRAIWNATGNHHRERADVLHEGGQHRHDASTSTTIWICVVRR